MIAFGYFAAVVGLAYWAGSRKAGYGVAVFLAGVLAYQVVIDGPASLLDNNGCQSYGARAQDC